MKKGIILVSIIVLLTACGERKNTKNPDTESYNRVGVDNVNGNMPDTTNTIDLSTHNDSAQKK